MSLRIYWRSASARRCVAELALAATLAAPLPALAGPDHKPAPAERVTAREAVDRQLTATLTRASEMNGVEAGLVMEVYRARIGKLIEPRREIDGGRAER